MSLAHYLILLMPLLNGTLPIVEQSRPSTSRLSRGPQQPSLIELASRPAAREAAAEALGTRRRLAVIRVPAAEEERLPPWAAPQALDVELADALRYSPQWIIDSPLTVRRRTASADVEVSTADAEISAADAAAIARQLAADQLVVVRLESPEGEAEQLQLVADRWSASPDGSWSVAATVRQPVDEAQRRTAVGQLALQLDPSLPPQKRPELAKPGTADNAAHAAWAAAIDHTLEAITSSSEERAQQQAERGLQRAEQALEVDPSFAAASLAAAACLEILGREAERGELLKRVYAVRDKRRTDLLTMQEFEADYARLSAGDADAAFAGYAELLETDPAHLPALWALVEVLSGDGTAPLASEDEALLGELVARILRAHPHSSVAALIAQAGKQ